MDFIIEFLLELILEGTIEVSSNKKISKFIRYPLIVLIIALFLVVIVGIFTIGICLLKESICASLIMIAISLVLLCTGIFKFKKKYIEQVANVKKDN